MKINFKKVLHNKKSESGRDWFERLKSKEVDYSTGIRILDKALLGGLNPGEIISIDGRDATGKSQLIFTIMCNYLIRMEKSDGFIVYGDFQHALDITRLRYLLKLKLNDINEDRIDKLLRKILYIHLNDDKDMHHLLTNFTVSCFFMYKHH